TSGTSKVNLIRTSFEIGWNALKIRFKRLEPVRILPSGQAMLGAGIAHRKKRFILHSTLAHQTSAIQTFSPQQHLMHAGVGAVLIFGFSQSPWVTAGIATAILSVMYFLDVLFQFLLITRSLSQPPELQFTDQEISALDNHDLPTYSILCPLYHEGKIVSNFVQSIEQLDWPKEKLDVLLL